jgi:hypothetical protein
MRFPGNGQLHVSLLSGGESVWMLRWIRRSGSSQLQAGLADGLKDLSHGAVKELPEWYTVLLRIRERIVVVYLDGVLAGYGEFESPEDDLTLALELSDGPVMQIKQLRIIPPDPTIDADHGPARLDLGTSVSGDGPG